MSDGFITNAGDTARLLAGRNGSPVGIGSGGTSPIIINVSGALDPGAVSRQIEQMLLGLKRSNGGTLAFG
jgi:hypothetical protein